MPTKISLPELPTLIQKLLEERQQHADALTRIDVVLAGVGAALGSPRAKANGRAELAPAAKAPARANKRRKGGKFAISAEASVLAFVKETKNPTTQEIKKRWAGEGRAGSADNTLSIMVKQKRLKRTPLGEGFEAAAIRCRDMALVIGQLKLTWTATNGYPTSFSSHRETKRRAGQLSDRPASQKQNQ